MQNKAAKVTLPNGSTVILESPDEFDAFFQDETLDLSKIKVEPFIPPRKTDVLDRVAGATAGAAVGAPAGLPGMAIGGTMGFAMPPKTIGEGAAMLAGGLGGPLVGKGVNAITRSMGPVKDFLTRLGAGVGEAEAGEIIKSTVDTGKPEGFNPLSLEGAIAGLLPNVESQMFQRVQNSMGGVNQRFKQLMPSLFQNKALARQLINEPTQTAAAEKGRQLSQNVFNMAAPAKKVIEEVTNVSLEPFRKIVESYDSNASDIVQKINMLKQTPHNGFFAAADNLATRVQLEKQLEDITEKSAKVSNELDLMRLHKEKNKIALKIAEENLNQSRNTVRGQIADLSTEQAKADLTANKKQLNLIQQMLGILNDKTTHPLIKREKLQILKLENDFNKTFWKGIEAGKDEIDKRYLRKELVDIGKELTADTKNLKARKATQRNILQTTQALVDQKGALRRLKEEQNQIKNQLGIPDIKNSLDVFRKELADKSILPLEVRKLYNATDTDGFVKNLRTMNESELNTITSFMKPDQQKIFKENMGDALIYDFFARAYDPQTGLFTKMNEAIQTGLPKVEFFTGNAEAQRTFIDLTNSMMRFTNQDASGKFGNYLKNAFTAASIRGFAYSSMYALFHTSRHASNLGIAGAAGAAGGVLGIAIPAMMSSAMKNPKLAKDLLAFIDGGGTISLSTLPYLSAYLKKEGKPVSQDELTSNKNLFDEIIQQGGIGNQQQPTQGNPPIVNSPAQVPQQSPPAPVGQ